jgi:predicted ribosome quality control (RQC) complex YloA/Tae2 family protein
MLRHYFTLFKVTEEIKCLTGSKLIEVFTQEKNSVIFNFFDGNQENSLQISTDTNLGAIFLRNHFARARKNTFDLFPTLDGQTLRSIKLIKNDRIILFTFPDYLIYAIFYGGARNNIFICDLNNNIIDSFKNKKQLTGSKFAPELQSIPKLSDFDGNITIGEALSKCNLLFGKYYANEFCVRNNLNKEIFINNFSKDELNKVEDEAIKFKDECIRAEQFYIYLIYEKPLLSLVKLSEYDDLRHTIDISISKAIEKRIIESYRRKSILPDYKKIITTLKRNEAKLEKILNNYEYESENIKRINTYKLYGELLNSQLNPYNKPGNIIIVDNYDGKQLEIPLESNLTIIENAGIYFNKAKNAKESENIRKNRLPQLKKELLDTKDKLFRLEKLYNDNNYKEMEKLIKESGVEKLHDSNIQPAKFRTFELGDGNIVFVGKDAANNDELTMKFAKSNDIWLHARGAGGSHTVLRMSGKAEKPPKYLLEKAAQIAAYYSQQRKAKYVPVAYTFKKYVRKPKGANPGSVVISKEEVIMVEPKLPE